MVTDRDVAELAARIAAEFHPQRIVLFGSRALGTARPDSDVDLLVVMPVKDSTFEASLEILNRIDPRFAVDLLVRDPEEVRWRYRDGDPFIRAALDTGRVLYEAAA